VTGVTKLSGIVFGTFLAKLTVTALRNFVLTGRLTFLQNKLEYRLQTFITIVKRSKANSNSGTLVSFTLVKKDLLQLKCPAEGTSRCLDHFYLFAEEKFHQTA
jgi:hypothetical protein